MFWRLLPGLAQLAALFALALALVSLPRWLLAHRFARAIVAPSEAPARSVAIVFGAGLRRDGTPTTVLADRVAVAAELYHAGKVEHLLMSGAAETLRGNEPLAMRNLALRLGVPSEAILIDPSGQRTFDTCLHARQRFGLHDAILVTQRYHLPRALATCSALGLQAVGVPADTHPYSRLALTIWQLREIPATWVALLETWLHHPPASDSARSLGPEAPHGS